MSEASERGGILSQPDPSVPATRVRYGVMGFLCSLSFLTYFDRVCIMRVQGDIQRDLSLTDEQLGMVFSAFWLAYALFEIPSGWFGDRYGPRMALLRIVLAWSLFTALSGTVGGFLSLLAFRFLFGVGEAGAYPNMAAVQSRWLPLKTRGRAGGLLWLFARWGGAFSPLIFGEMLRQLDAQTFRQFASSIPGLSFLRDVAAWRMGFFCSGIVGLFWCAAFYSWFRDNPAEKKGVNQAELDLINAGRDGSAQKGHSAEAGIWSSLFASPSLWAMAGLYICGSFGWSFFVSWMPRFLKDVHGITFEKSEWISVMPLFCGGLACLIGGTLSDFVVARTGWRRMGRAIFPIAGCTVAACAMYGIHFAKTPFQAAVLMVIAAAAYDFGQAANWATIVDIGGKYSGTATGFINMVGNFGNSLQPIIGAMIFKQFGWNVLFVVYAAAFLAAASMWFFIDPRRTFYEGRPIAEAPPQPVMVPAGDRGGIA